LREKMIAGWKKDERQRDFHRTSNIEHRIRNPQSLLAFSVFLLVVSALCLVPPAPRVRGDGGGKEPLLLEVGGDVKSDKPLPAPAELKVVSYNIRYRAGDDLKQLIKLLKEDPEIGGAHVIGLQEIGRAHV